MLSYGMDVSLMKKKTLVAHARRISSSYLKTLTLQNNLLVSLVPYTNAEALVRGFKGKSLKEKHDPLQKMPSCSVNRRQSLTGQKMGFRGDLLAHLYYQIVT